MLTISLASYRPLASSFMYEQNNECDCIYKPLMDGRAHLWTGRTWAKNPVTDVLETDRPTDNLEGLRRRLRSYRFLAAKGTPFV